VEYCTVAGTWQVRPLDYSLFIASTQKKLNDSSFLGPLSKYLCRVELQLNIDQYKRITV
jgi:hypothetical protein